MGQSSDPQPDDAERARLLGLWSGEFGDAYVSRNDQAARYRGPFWDELLGRFPVASALEVGCNVGGNLRWFVASTLLSGLASVVGAVTLRSLVTRQERYAERFNLRDATAARSYLSASTGATPPGWFPDPAGRFDHRWWDGARWTETVSRNGSTTTDPL